MKLLIDAGNSRCKWALMTDSGELNTHGIIDYHALPQLDLPTEFYQADAIWIANVAGPQIQRLLEQRLQSLAVPIQVMQVGDADLGLQNAYAQPQQLGIDRWCAGIAAWQILQLRQSETACLVINAGTALTIDAIHQDTFIGGLIVPGARLQTESLAQLAFSQANFDLSENNPILSQGKLCAFPNQSIDACFSGVIQALIGAISIQYHQLQTHTQKPVCCILSGGDAEMIAAGLAQQKIPFELIPHLVLQGIYLLGSQSKFS